MKIIDDSQIFRPLVERAIQKFGYAPEHNLDWWVDYTSFKQKPIFVEWPDGSGLLTHKSDKDWNLFSEPLMSQSSSGKQIIEFVEFALSQSGIERVTIEAREETRQRILEALSPSLKAQPIDYTLVWPVMNLQKFDPLMPGNHFKSLRNAKNKFYREHAVEVLDILSISKEELRSIVKKWSAILNSKSMEDVLDYTYFNLIDANFGGTKTARALSVDGNPVGFNAGWTIPNSDIFYSSIGVHDYSLPDLGVVLYLEDLEWIKSTGYKTADMGGVEVGSPLNFKNQFLPESWYKTFVFSIIKK